MNVTLVAINAMYLHTSLSVRLLSKAVEGLPIRHTPLELNINMREEAMLRKIYDTTPDILCFSCYIWNIRQVLPLLGSVQKLLPHVRVVLGGPEVGHNSSDYLAKYPQIDAIVCGEGEVRYRLLLLSFLQGGNGEGIKGVCTAGAASGAPPADEPVPLSRLLPAYTSVSFYDPVRIWYAETSRGCPFSCQFCLSSLQHGVRALGEKEAVSVLRWMADHGARLVKLIDRTFNFDPARAIAIWKGLLETTGECAFHFEIEPSLLNEETLRFLSGVPKGKFQFEIGIQSTNPQTLRHVSRRLHHEHVRDALQTLRSFENIPLHLDLIAGLPFEGYASFEKSFNDAFEMGPTALQVGFLKLLHGSGLRRDAALYGIVYSEEAPYEVFYTDFLSHREILRLKDIAKTVDWYYNANQCQASIALLLTYGAPFAVFESIAACLRARGAFDAPVSQANRLEALLAAGLPLTPAQDTPVLYDAIRFDGLLHGLSPAQLPKECRKNPLENNLLRQKYPQYCKTRESKIAYFSFDIPALLQNRRLVKKETTLWIRPRDLAYAVLSDQLAPTIVNQITK